jgi:hypothetical protein
MVKHTFDIAAFGLCVFSPSPDRIKQKRHAHAAADLEHQGIIHLGTSSGWFLLLGTAHSPHLGQDFRQPFGEVVAGHRYTPNRPDGSVEKTLGVFHIYMRRKETLAELEECAGSSNHHLVHVVGRVG